MAPGWWLPVVALLVVLAAACGRSGPTTPTTTSSPTPSSLEPVRLGVLLPLRGTLADVGQELERSVRLAERHLGEAGVPVELVVADDATHPPTAVAEARRLLQEARVQGVVGGVVSPLALPVAQEVTIPSGVVLISPAATSPLLTALPADQGRDLVFRTVPSAALQGDVLARLAQRAGYTRAAVLHVNDPYGQGVAERFASAFGELGGEVVARVPHAEGVQPTYEVELQRAARERPDVLVAVSYPSQVARYLKQAVEEGLFSAFLLADGARTEQVLEAVGAAALEGVLGTAPGASLSQGRRAFTLAFQEAHGRTATLPFAANAYDAVALLGLAGLHAQVQGWAPGGLALRDSLRAVAGPPGEPVLPGPDGVRQAAELLRAGQDVDYEGTSGPVDFDASGDVTGPVEVWRVTAGAIESVGLEELP